MRITRNCKLFFLSLSLFMTEPGATTTDPTAGSELRPHFGELLGPSPPDPYHYVGGYDHHHQQHYSPTFVGSKEAEFNSSEVDGYHGIGIGGGSSGGNSGQLQPIPPPPGSFPDQHAGMWSRLSEEASSSLASSSQPYNCSY